MKIVSTAEMRAIDRAATQRFGVASLTLMENAGAAVAGYVLDDRQHAAFEEPVARRSGKLGDAVRLGTVGSVADHRMRPGNWNVEHRQAVDRDAEISEIVGNQPGTEPDRNLGLRVRQRS